MMIMIRILMLGMMILKFVIDGGVFVVNSDTLVVRISSDLKSALRDAAAADGRSISNYVLMLIRSALDKR